MPHPWWRAPGASLPAMTTIRFALLRGVCQLPAYVGHEKGLFAARGLTSEVSITPTAWLIPEQLGSGAADFAVLPWTRVAATEEGDAPLRIVSGSGIEEAAVVVRTGLEVDEVRSVAIPREGGMKDLTALGLLKGLGWDDGSVEQRRFPSGDGAIICFVGGGADAASMIEPYATMMEHLGLGRVVRRTGDVWPGAPGCSLATTVARVEQEPELVQQVVDAYVEAARFVDEHRDEAAAIAAGYIGVSAEIVREALDANRPSVDAVRNADAMTTVLHFMRDLGYIDAVPTSYQDLRFLDAAQRAG